MSNRFAMPVSPSLALARCLAPGPLPAADNMALDDVLLDEPGWFVRLTRWQEPAVTLGRFQCWPRGADAVPGDLPPLHPCGDDVSPPGSLAAVRRVTGGGAIVHGDDLTIAVAGDCPSKIFPRRKPAEIATSFATILSRLFEAPSAHRGGADREASMKNIDDCFARQSPSDVVVETPDGLVKAGGIALAFRGDRVLIEASLRRDLLAAAVEDDRDRLVRLAIALGLKPGQWEQQAQLVEGPWAAEIARRVDHKFGHPDWNRG